MHSRSDSARHDVLEKLRLTQFAVDCAADAIYWMDDQARFVYVNGSACRSLGYSRDELLSMCVHDIDPQYPLDAWPRHWAELRRRGSLTLQSVHRRKSGECFPVEITANYLKYEGREYNCAYARDVTEHKQAEQRLKEQNEFLHSVLESLTHPFYVIDARDYTIKMANSAARLGELGPHTTCYELTHRSPVPCHVAGEACPLERVRTTGQPCVMEHVHHDRGGDARICEVHAYPVFDRSGQVVQIIEYSLDVTARRKTEEELRQAKAAAEDAGRAKDHFLAVLSHELRTPLTPVLATASILRNDPQLPQAYRDDVELIRRNVELEARLIDDLLDVTRISRGKIELDRKPMPLRDLMDRAVETCRSDMEAKRLHFGIDLGDAAACVVEADAARLQQVFWNLLKNAIKFTPPGGCVDIRATSEGAALRVEVSDSGEGIDPAVLPRVFNAFEQGGVSTTRQFGGLGLGLTIARRLAELHGGTITAHSEGKGKGAMFTVRLPIAGRQLPNDKAGGVTPNRESEIGNRQLRILLVEDHGDTAKIMQRLLTAVGHQVQTAGDVATALDLAGGAHKFDLLVSDLGLPGRSGLDLMRELRADGHQFPGIAVSGYGQEQDVVGTRAAGFVLHLTKPIAPERLIEAIQTVAASVASPPGSQ